MKFSKRTIALLLFAQHEIQTGAAWQVTNHPHRASSILSVTSRDVAETTKEDQSVPYVISRGDGSTGGGGLPMPNAQDDDDDGLTRPKVGAKMPEG